MNKRNVALATMIILAVLLVACTATPTPTPPVSRSIERVGVLDTSGQGVVTWGGNVEAYSDQGTTQKFKVTGSNGNTAIAGILSLSAGTSITVTNGVAFAVSASTQPIVSAGTVTPTITIPSAGSRFCLYNTGTNTINIADSGNQVLVSTFALGQYDSICFWSDGTRVIELSRSNN